MADASTGEQQESLQVELIKKVSQANSLYADKKGDLQLAVSILELATAHDARTHYPIGSFFYLWSLKKGDMDANYQTIKEETRRLLPLLSNEKKKQWETYLENKNPQLLNEMYGFWVTRDTSPSTEVNERLIEHWQRIAYAREHFTKREDPPYGTDDRGRIFVRLGPPDLKREETIQFDDVLDPLGRRLQLKLGQFVRGTFEIWNYYDTADGDVFFIFGLRKGQEPYGLRNSIVDIFALHNIDFENLSSSPREERRIAQYAIFKNVRTFESQFDNIYTNIKNTFLTDVTRFNPVKGEPLPIDIIVNSIRTFGDIQANDQFKTQQQMRRAPAEKSFIANNSLDFRHRFYRFRDQQNNPEYVFAAATKPDPAHADTATYYTQNNLYVYDESWTLQGHTSRANRTPESPMVFTLKNATDESRLYFSSELLGRTSETAATLVSSSGKQQLQLPAPLETATPFTVSDIVLANEQEPDYENKLPVVPKLESTFAENQPIMIYFESYGVPEGGYSFRYFFTKDRLVGGPKKLERTEITVLADKAQPRDSQLFTINPDDLEPGTYELVFRFSPLENSAASNPVEKKVEIKIEE